MSYQNTHHQGNSDNQKSKPKPFFSKAIAPVTQPFFQSKLTINQAGDKYEQEADAIAEQVVTQSSITSHQSPITLHHSPTSSLARKCSKCKEEDRLQREELKEEESETLQAKKLMRSSDVGGQSVTSHFTSQLNSSKGGGSTLPKDTLSSMNQAFGADFSNVRIHTDGKAQEMSENIQAKAFTHGSDIYFNKGQYDLGSKGGKKLLAHELTHTVQQEGSRHRIQKFEAGLHESAERVGLTTDEDGKASSDGLSEEEASAVYFGNWMRDVNQAFVPTLVDILGNDVIFSLLNFIASKKFGRLLTPEQLGYYIPAEHIDNPAGLVKKDDLLSEPPTIINALKPENAPTRPGEYDTPQEDVSPSTSINGANIFNVDQSGVMSYIRRTNTHVEKRLELAVKRGRNPEGMMHFGAALHAIEDLFAHSNWVEIAVEKILKKDSEKKDSEEENESTLLPELKGDSRKIFNYSIDVNLKKYGKEQNRPVLTTGSFTTGDTMVSILSEIVNILNQPLSEPTVEDFDVKIKNSDLKRNAEEKFVIALIRKFENEIKNNSTFKDNLKKMLTENGVPEIAADRFLELPMEDIYKLTTIFGIQLPPFIPMKIRKIIRAQIQGVMKFIGAKIQAEALQVKIADTSLVNFLQETKNIQQGDYSSVEGMMKLKDQLGMGSLEKQKKEAKEVASRHQSALQHTPEAIVAGPSHSQISKDHSNSPFFGIAFNLASIAVRRMRKKMIEAWNEQSNSNANPYDFSWDNFPNNQDEKKLFHDNRNERLEEDKRSLNRGKRIVSQGGDVEAGQTFESYDLKTMRKDSADNIRRVATILNTISDSPQQGVLMLRLLDQDLKRSLGNSDVLDTLITKVSQEIMDMSSFLDRNGRTFNRSTEMKKTSQELDEIATKIEGAVTYDEREKSNKELVSYRNQTLFILADVPGISNSLKAAVILLIDDEISRTAVSYSRQQKEILESTSDVFPIHTGPRSLQVVKFNPENLENKKPKLKALLKESRMILNHPYESDWWVPTIKKYIKTHSEQIKTDIEARNTGVPVLRRPGGHFSGH